MPNTEGSERSTGSGRNPPSLSILLGCLGLIAAFSLLWPTYRAFLAVEIDSNEGWNAYYADAAMGRMPLYASRDRLITNNYPPLSFYIVGALGSLIGDVVLAGRLLSLLAVAVTAGSAALTIKRLGGNTAAAGVGTAYFVATMGFFFHTYVGMNDPHLLAQAVMTLGFVAFLRAMARDDGYWLPILLMVAAGFIKHNIIAMPLTALIWLGIHRPRQLVKAGLLAACAIAAGFACCFAAFGPDFFSNLLSPRALVWKQAIGSVGHLQWIAVGLLAWLYVGLARRGTGDPDVQFCSLFVVLALLSFFVQKTGAGVAHNAQFELVFAVSIAVGLAFAKAPLLPLAERYSPHALRCALLLVICLRLLLPTPTDPVRLLTDASFHADIAEREAAMSASVVRIQATPGDVAGSMLASYRAGKPLAFDLFNTRQRIVAGQLPPDAIIKLLDSGRLTIVEDDPGFEKECRLAPPGDHAAAK
jgi:Dolichyl-phosphate-mannose-protein mannosyltransferase